jgi:hypothetical protein
MSTDIVISSGQQHLLSSTAKPPRNWKNFNHQGAIRPLVCGAEGFSIKSYFSFLMRLRRLCGYFFFKNSPGLSCFSDWKK